MSQSSFNVRALQVVALLGLGVWFLAIPQSRGEGECLMEGECTFLKPAMMLTLDYSTDMNLPHGQLTRWQATVDAVNALLEYDNGFFQENLKVGVMRVGHDPDPNQPDTPIPGDASGLLDGQALDIPWYAEDLAWFDCMGMVIADTLDQLPPPLDGDTDGIGAWQAGAAHRVAQLVDQARADHPEDDEKVRPYFNIVFTGSPWTGATGTDQPAQDDPEPVIADLLQGHDVPTYVVRVGDGLPQNEADAWAASGGTMLAHAVDDQMSLQSALDDLVQQTKDDLVLPDCTPGLPRITVVLDASSDMLNVDGQAGMMDETPWDLTADLLRSSSLWGGNVKGWLAVEDLTLSSLVVFGSALPGEQRLVVPTGVCSVGNGAFGWALSPAVSCQMPGCDDPWGGPDIEWTFADQSSDTFACWFAPETTSHMPQCHGNGPACEGSGRFVHLGLNEALEQRQTYHAANLGPNAEQPVDDNTLYYNILVVGGSYQGYSSDAQVQQALGDNLAAGIITFVLAVGPAADDPQLEAELSQMAAWGSAGQYPYYTPDTVTDLRDVFVGVIDAIEYDPCCGFPGCNGEWGVCDEPDPVPPPPDTGGSDESGGDTGDTGDTGGTDSSGADESTNGSDSVGDEATGDPDGSDDTGSSAGAGAESGLGRGCACAAGEHGSEGAWRWGVVALAWGRRRRRAGGSRRWRTS